MTTPALTPPDALETPAAPSRSRAGLLRAVAWLGIAAIVVIAGLYGMHLRQQAFVYTSPIRFNSDVNRGWGWGWHNYNNWKNQGKTLFDTYDEVGIQARDTGHWIDYAPLRLGVMTMWAAFNDRHGFSGRTRPTPRPGPEYIDRELRFHKFPLRFNAAMEAIGAVAAFLTVHFVVRRNRGMRLLPVNHFTGVPHAFAAAMLLWFNPAMIFSAHTWITWDMWIVPPFLWAVYFACRRWWFWAGVVMAIGALFKGQQFFVLPVFILWPLFQGRVPSALRFLAGFAIGFAVLTAPFTMAAIVPKPLGDGLRHLHWPSIVYAVCVAVAVVALPLVRRFVVKRFAEQKQLWWALMITLGIAALALTIWPVYGHSPKSLFGAAGITLALLCVAAAILIPLRSIPVAAAGAIGAAMILCTPLFEISYAWFDASYLFGTNHWEKDTMIMGLSDNLPGILKARYGWRDPLDVVFMWGAYPVTMKKLLLAIFATLLVFTSAGVAMHDRRGSTRFLVAIVTPWLLFFTFPAQIHERYLLFGAAAAALCIGHSVGMALMGVFLSIIAWMMPLHVMLRSGNRRLIGTDGWPTMGEDFNWFLDRTHPDLGWAVILATLVFFYFAVTPVWKWRRLNDALPAGGGFDVVEKPAPQAMPDPSPPGATSAPGG